MATESGRNTESSHWHYLAIAERHAFRASLEVQDRPSWDDVMARLIFHIGSQLAVSLASNWRRQLGGLSKTSGPKCAEAPSSSAAMHVTTFRLRQTPMLIYPAWQKEADIDIKPGTDRCSHRVAEVSQAADSRDLAPG